MPQYRSSLLQVLSLVDAKTGVIRDVQLFKNVADDPSVFCAVAMPASLAPLIGFDFDNRGAACALDPAGATLRACGELIERYSSAFIDRSTLTWASEDSLKTRGVKFFGAQEFYAFAPGQFSRCDFPYASPNPQAEKFWTLAESADFSDHAFVPASCVYLPYCFPGEYVTHAPISTGMAAGLTRDSCLQKGAAEIVERDALMLHWKCRITAPAIDPQSIAGARPDLYQLIASTRHLSARWRFNLLTLDIDVPVISATLINDEGIPLTSFGIASNVCPLEAAASAMQEALLSRFLLNRTNLAPLESEINVSRFRTLRDHLFGHAVSASLRDSFLELFGGQPVIDVAQLEARFAGCKSVVSALNKAGLEVYCVDITSEDIRSAGIEVWRVLVPTAEPLDNDHLYQHQGGERLSRFLKNKGVATYNMLPHPFP